MSYNANTNYTSPLTATEAAKLSEVPSEIEQLTFNLEMLDKAVNELETRLLTVLALRADNENKAPSAPSPVRVPLADRLHQHVLHVQHIINQVRSLTERVEL